jgi:hypothetical protein
MDLDDFEEQLAQKTVSLASREPRDALRYLDQKWWVKASRSARWMDLIGDYAGTEPFVLDGESFSVHAAQWTRLTGLPGESLIQVVLDDPLLSLGRDSGQSHVLTNTSALTTM